MHRSPDLLGFPRCVLPQIEVDFVRLFGRKKERGRTLGSILPDLILVCVLGRLRKEAV